jgi:hypothetical protein
VLRWEGQVARMEEMRNAYAVLVGKCYAKWSFVRFMRRSEDQFKTCRKEIVWHYAN